MGPEVIILLAMVMACQIDARPEKAYAKGYSKGNLPPGRWTRWFDSSQSGLVGDYETVENVVREFGRGCDGLPCRRPVAVKAISIYGLTPSEHHDKVHLHARRGLICRHNEQADGKCMDYKVRFYCPSSETNCERKHHHHKSQQNANELTEEQKEKKSAKLRYKQTAVKHPNEVVNYFKNDDNIVVEIPNYVKYPIQSPRVILPNLRGSFAQLPEYNDAMTSHNRRFQNQHGGLPEPNVMFSYRKEDPPTDSVPHESTRRKDVLPDDILTDSAPSVNRNGESYPQGRVDIERENSLLYRHFLKRPKHQHPRAPRSS